jgi:hypothetical protein
LPQTICLRLLTLMHLTPTTKIRMISSGIVPARPLMQSVVTKPAGPCCDNADPF